MLYIYLYRCYLSTYLFIQSASENSGCGLFLFRIYEEYHINLYECSMYGYCDITYSLAEI